MAKFIIQETIISEITKQMAEEMAEQGLDRSVLMRNLVNNLIKENSDSAIKQGNKFPGYLGKSVAELSRKEIEMVLNIVWNELQKTKENLYKSQRL